MAIERKSEPRSERIIIPLPPSMVDAIREYWHEQKFDSRAEAIRHLLAFALDKRPPRHRSTNA